VIRWRERLASAKAVGREPNPDTQLLLNQRLSQEDDKQVQVRNWSASLRSIEVSAELG
jgi:hypothetical protein